MSDYTRINRKDNVAVALKNLRKGMNIVVDDVNVTLLEDIEQGHKIALFDLNSGDTVIKYGYPIGKASESISAGAHVHVHNVTTGLKDNLNYSYNPAKSQVKGYDIDPKDAYFMGYERADGRVGIRNDIWVVPTVGCVNSGAATIAGKTGAIAYSHPYGCSQLGDDQENTRHALASIINHPNAGGVLVLGLGCENSNIDVLKGYLGNYDNNRIRFLVCQDVEDEIEEGIKIVNELKEIASKDVRSKQPVSKLIVGLKCGGSDGLSGITANPTVGIVSDIITSLGGSTILTEVPEMFGAEEILMARAENETVFNKTVALINDFKDLFRNNGQEIYENPSPGNKAGGITTLEDKALGCTEKSGSAKVVDVLDYGESLKKSGLNLLNAPGNDLVASTALAISGAQIVLFTTGRGTPFASPVPTVKISSNTDLAVRKTGWIDYDCGRLVSEETDYEQLGRELFGMVMRIAGGERVKSEKAGYSELAIWKQGVTL